jgi:putative lipoprotein
VAPTPAPTPTISATDVTGGWSRTAPGGGGRQALLIRPDGSLTVLGIPRTEGVSWRLEEDTFVAVLDVEPAPDKEPARLRIEPATPGRLVLAGGAPLAGIWERRTFAALAGTITYVQRVALTPEAIVQIELKDVSRADLDAPVIAKQILRPAGKQVPLPFSLDYDPADIQPGRAYALTARITDRGQLAFVTDTKVPVLTGGAPANAEIVVVPVH